MNPPDDIFHNTADKLTAKEIIEAERRENEAKTARLREARLAKEALEPPPAAKPRRRPAIGLSRRRRKSPSDGHRGSRGNFGDRPRPDHGLSKFPLLNERDFRLPCRSE